MTPEGMPVWLWALVTVVVALVGSGAAAALVNRKHSALAAKATAAQAGAEAARTEAETYSRRAHDLMDIAQKAAEDAIAKAQLIAGKTLELSEARHQLAIADSTINQARADLGHAKDEVAHALATLSLRDNEIAKLNQHVTDCNARLKELEEQAGRLRGRVASLEATRTVNEDQQRQPPMETPE
ncbi:MAG TPA: hypothetical protein VNJ70_17905 [Thermoanaerobaculia bacterium]|nr:hypothetical protein [Thermoanaerobaculia bacterium]